MRMLRKPQVCDKVGLCARQIDEMEAAGTFPRRVVLNPDGGRAVAWFEHEIDAHLKALAAARELA